MLDIRRILFPTDFSDRAQAALPMALRLAELHRAELHFLHVVNPGGDEPSDVPMPFPGESQASATLDAADGSSDQTSVTRHVTKGRDPGVAILEFARDLDVDLIVIG